MYRGRRTAVSMLLYRPKLMLFLASPVLSAIE